MEFYEIKTFGEKELFVNNWFNDDKHEDDLNTRNHYEDNIVHMLYKELRKYKKERIQEELNQASNETIIENYNDLVKFLNLNKNKENDDIEHEYNRQCSSKSLMENYNFFNENNFQKFSALNSLADDLINENQANKTKVFFFYLVFLNSLILINFFSIFLV